jgi:predicted ATPase
LARDQKFYPEEVSDGTIKWLCLLVSIYVSSSRIYLLEEPENFLHPWMQQRLISTMREQAELTKTIFVLTTHSSTILNATRLEEVFVVTPGDMGTRVQRIADREEVANVLTDSAFGLGDLWVSGAISGVPGSDD